MKTKPYPDRGKEILDQEIFGGNCPFEEGVMEMVTVNENEIARWIEEHQREMIICPHQPGLLLISKKACIKRYKAALGRAFETISEDDSFHYVLKKGLSLCEGCPIGRKLVEEEKRSASPQGELLEKEATQQS